MPVDDAVLISLTTPDEVLVEDRKVVFDGGIPTRAGADDAYAFMDRTAAFDAFVQGLPAVSLWAIHKGFTGAGIQDGDVLVTSGLLDCRTLLLTANCDTVYFIFFLDLSGGPVLVDMPPGVLGAADDMWWRWVTDFGVPGPDRGEGGRYLFAGPDYEGTLPEGGVFVARSRTNRVALFGWAFLEDDDPAPVVARIKDGLKITPYTPGGLGTSIASFLDGESPLGQLGEPRTPRFVEGSGLAFNTCPPSDPDAFYRLLDEAVQAEPASALDPEVAAPIAAVGVVKDRPFSPDERMAGVLAEAGAAANACVRSVAIRPRRSEGFHFYPDTDSNWISPLFAGGYSFQTPPPLADGSITVWFGPVKPDSVADGNWIKTDPDRAWFALLRFYNPLPTFFDKSWRPGEIKLVDGKEA